jgi:hypothetical protein
MHIRLLAFGVAGALAACSATEQTAPTVPGGNDASTDGASEAGPPAFVFMPQGCPYTVSPLTTWALQDLALDDPNGATDAPIRVRLGFGGGTTAGHGDYPDPTTTAAIAWETPTANHVAKVRIGTSAQSMTDVHAGYTWTTPPPAIGIGGNEPPTFMHEVHICGLTPATTYYYQVGGGSGAGTWSATQSFTTVPATGKVTFGFSGDSRDLPTTLQAVQVRMRDAAVNFQLYSGDLVDIGTFEQLYSAAFDAMWKDPSDNTKFLTLGQQLFATMAGNHENEAARFFAAFPIPGDGPYAKTYYSFNAGTAHIAVFDEQVLAAGGDPPNAQAAAQLAWLDQDLAAANMDRTAHPIVIVVAHRGLYSTSNHGNDADVLFARQKMSALFDKYAVDAVLNGHDHEYERSLPIKGGMPATCALPCANVTDTQGTTYVINGGAGADPYAIAMIHASFTAKSVGFGSQNPMYIGTYGIGTIMGNTLTLTSYGLKMSSSTVMGDDVVDNVTITH